MKPLKSIASRAAEACRIVCHGIFTRVIRPPAPMVPATSDNLLLLAEKICRNDAQSAVDAIRGDAINVLNRHGIQVDGNGKPTFRYGNGESTVPNDDDDTHPEEVRDAAEILDRIHAEAPEIHGFVFNDIFQAGRAYERMLAREAEPLAAIGRKCREEGRKGGSAEKLTDDERRERIERADKAIAEYKKRYGHDCKVVMMWNRISRKLGFCKKSYDRYVKSLRKADKDSGDNPR